MKKNNHILFWGITITLLLAVFFSCKDDDSYKENTLSVLFPTDQLNVDLNELSHPSLIFVVNSDIALKSISVFVVNDDGTEEKIDNDIINFYNPHNHSVNLKPTYTDKMVEFKITIKDNKENTREIKYPINVKPLSGLPEVYFSDGTNDLTNIKYVEGDPSPDLFVHVSSEEPLNYLIIYQQKGYYTDMINDTIWFYNQEQEATINIKTEGDGYNFERGLTAIKARIAAGVRNKIRENEISVDFSAAIKLHPNQTNDDYNGLLKNEEVPFSGSIEVATEVQELTYQLFARDGSLLGGEQSLDFSSNTDNSYTGSFIADPTLGKIRFKATSTNGKVDEETFDVHVGYKQYHLLSSITGDAPTHNINTSPGCFFSAEKGAIYEYCEAERNSEFVDVGFVTWTSHRNLRVMKIESIKFRTPICSPVSHEDGSIRTWPTVKLVDVVTCRDILIDDFFRSTIIDIEEASVNWPYSSQGVEFADDFALYPKGKDVAIYETEINGKMKKVIMAFDKTESIGDRAIFSTFWFYAKVQL